MSASSQRKLREVSSDGDAPLNTGLQPNPNPQATVLDTNPYLPGEVIGDRYRLAREIGRGGMGVVWVAHSLVLGIDVAVKLIRADIAGAGWASRMAREAHAAARLGHPAMVRVFDFGWTNRGDPFLVMELVHGDTLARVIEREGRLPAIRAVQTLLPIADGLRLAHERSIIHRDIKPDNILLASDALGRLQPKLLDFGIAKVGPAQSSGKLTQIGAVLGSPEYMSPEQARGLESVDGRSDVWSLAIALYELLTGRVPFDQPNYNALMHSIIHDEPTPLINHGIGDNGLWEILLHALAKEPEERFATMSEFGEALALWLYQHGIKEDLCGNSIRALWLDSPLSHLQFTPEPNHTPAPQNPLRSQSMPTVAGGQRYETLSGDARRRKLIPVGVAASVLLTAAGYFAMRAPGPVAEERVEPSPAILPMPEPLSIPQAEAQAERQTTRSSALQDSRAAKEDSRLIKGRPGRGGAKTRSARDFGF